jgi:nucleotide-binding universal stress UspA family protein
VDDRAETTEIDGSERQVTPLAAERPLGRMARGDGAAGPCRSARRDIDDAYDQPDANEVITVRILFGTDGSTAAFGALEQLLASFALPADTVVDVLAVEPADFGAGVGADGIAGTNIAAAMRRLGAAGVAATGTMAFGDPATELIARAEATSPDLVVLGADRGGAIGPHPLATSIGRVATTVALEGHASVLVSASPDAIRRVVLGSDGSAEAERALGLLIGLPFRARPEIVVVAVAEASGSAAGVRTEDRGPTAGSAREAFDIAGAIAAEAADRVRPFSSRTDVRTPGGPAVEQLPVIADETGADLVVVGTRGLGARQRRRLGSVAASLLQRMPASLLIARAAPETP